MHRNFTVPHCTVISERREAASSLEHVRSQWMRCAQENL
jgi:hypothetical protein